MAAFVLQWQRWIIVTETIYSAKPKNNYNLGPKKFANPIKDYRRLPNLEMWFSLSSQRASPAFLSIGIYPHLYSTCTRAQFESIVLQCSPWLPLKSPKGYVILLIYLHLFYQSSLNKLSWIFALLPTTCLLQSKVKAINSFSLKVISFPASLLHKSTDSCFCYVTVQFLIPCRILPKFFFSYLISTI